MSSLELKDRIMLDMIKHHIHDEEEYNEVRKYIKSNIEIKQSMTRQNLLLREKWGSLNEQNEKTTQGNPYLISTEEFFSFAGAAAAGHAAAPLWHHPWLKNTRKVVHKAAEDHHTRFLELRLIDLEEELRQVREQLRRRGVTIKI